MRASNEAAASRRMAPRARRFPGLLVGVLLLYAGGAAAQTERPSLEGIMDAMCMLADQKSETLRPLVCEPRCGCSLDASATVTSCAEGPTGTYTIQGGLPQQCWLPDGLCPHLPLQPPYCCSNSDCVAGYVCINPPPFQCGVSSFGGSCVKTCSQDSDCLAIPFTVVLENVTAAGGGEVATCETGGSSYPLNSRDASACVAEAEAALGESCSEAP